MTENQSIIKENEKADEKLKRIFKTIGSEYGYESVDAEFVAFKEFKVRWQRSYKWAEFKVSDYMMDATPEVIDGLARTLFSKIANTENILYSKDMCEWATSDEFVKSKQPVYLRRSRSLTRNTKGKFRNLEGSFGNLLKMGLVKEDPDMVMSWLKEPMSRRTGYSSILMKVIAITPVLDDENVPEYVLDYVLYHEYLRMTEGKKYFGKMDIPDNRELEKMYPNYNAAEGWLNKLCLYQ